MEEDMKKPLKVFVDKPNARIFVESEDLGVEISCDAFYVDGTGTLNFQNSEMVSNDQRII